MTKDEDEISNVMIFIVLLDILPGRLEPSALPTGRAFCLVSNYSFLTAFQNVILAVLPTTKFLWSPAFGKQHILSLSFRLLHWQSKNS
jgi:hypothetical protein